MPPETSGTMPAWSARTHGLGPYCGVDVDACTCDRGDRPEWDERVDDEGEAA